MDERRAIDELEHGDGGYLHVARQPLQILAFLLPLIVAYELGLALVLRSDDGVITNKAHESLLHFFQSLGVPAAGGLYLGGILIVVVLLTWHLLARQPWRIDRPAVLLMGVESFVLTLPLLALGLLVQRSVAAAPAGPAPVELAELGLLSRMAISVGAGLYEELVFRMMLIAVLHTLLVDLARLPHGWGAAIAIVVSAAAFTWYHPLGGPDGGIVPARVLFYFLAGLYFGAIYLVRGFGIAVGVHALYDIVTVVLLAGESG